MSGDRGGFVPKGFVKLREAIEAIGKALEPDWTGAEQEPENWDLLDGPHVQMRERAERVWNLLRLELHGYTYRFGYPDPCVVLDDRGEISSVPAGIWGLPEAETLLRDCAFDKREIFVGEAFLESLLYVEYRPSLHPVESQARRPREDQAGLPVGAAAGADDSDDHETPKKQAFSQAKAEAAYKQRIDEWPENKRHPSRADDEAWLKQNFGVTRTPAREIRNLHAPEGWKEDGAPKSSA